MILSTICIMVKSSKGLSNGLIYPLVDRTIRFLYYLNLVELFKYVAVLLVRSAENKRLTATRIATDVFILVKWSFLLIVFLGQQFSLMLNWTVWYLLITNVFTYFYYHTWCDDVQHRNKFDSHRVRRRFLNLGLSFLYSIFCFAYLYSVGHAAEFQNSSNENILSSLLLSTATAFASDYSLIQPNTELGQFIIITQSAITFIYVSIILSNSIPQSQN